jgi:hypothetical protein
MTGTEFEAWVRIRNTLFEAVRHMDGWLSDFDKELITDFIENNEYGVAIDWIDALAAKRSLDVPLPAKACLDEARAAIGKSGDDGPDGFPPGPVSGRT